MAWDPAHAGSARADLAVSVTVIDQCLIRAESRSASCAGGAAYELGIGRERIDVPADQVTISDEQGHTEQDGSRRGISQSFAGAAGPRDASLAMGAVRTVAATAAPIDAIRITYSF